jgi:hypothetical protein
MVWQRFARVWGSGRRLEQFKFGVYLMGEQRQRAAGGG